MLPQAATQRQTVNRLPVGQLRGQLGSPAPTPKYLYPPAPFRAQDTPVSVATVPALADSVAHLAADGLNGASIAHTTGLSEATVSRLLAKQGPVVSLLKAVKRDEMLAGWQWLYLDTLDRVQDAPQMTMSDRRNAAVVMGISSEKVLLLSGQPSQIVSHLHDVRVSLPEIASRLADVGRALKYPHPVVVDMPELHESTE